MVERGQERRSSSRVAPEHQRRVERLERFASLLDEAFQIPGTKFRVGWDSIIGLVPGVGDLTTALLSAYIIFEARRLGLPKRTLMRMAGNVGLDTLLGSVPLIGDLFDATFKANKKNMRLMKERLQRRSAAP
ncbi:MAG: DUF4112 domain-containing protein [Planctomycetota bacterium]|nr:MAG: DUF4112 domain-containing protein [Planctomycetota bacterium]REK19989.1 MAG: DUF4112 domain-containing protein [Planctomycetota bacterium]REK27556.1 MAG: DUF4112 domain-containing protein [Planctomycetota bacterium]